MNVIEKFYIHNLSKQNQHLNDKHTITKSDFSYNNHTNLKTKYKPRKIPTEQTKQSSTHNTPPTDIM